jgi:uncharacterized membrane protein YkoI
MGSAHRFALAPLAALALVLALVLLAPPQPRADEPVAQACLNQKERRAEAESGRLIRLASAMRAARARMPGTVVQARLCHGPEGLVYVLTVLAHDGKVARIAVDAVKGTVVGGL